MTDRIKNLITVIVTVIIIFGLSLWCFIKPADEISTSERRKLRQLPEISRDTLLGLNGKTTFMSSFEKYAADQFPIRESFRSINSLSTFYLLGKSEINRLFSYDGYIAKLDYEINRDSVDWSLDRLKFVTQKYAGDNNVYLAIIPDKNYYIAQESGYPYIDFDTFTETFRAGMGERVQYIDLKEQLSLDNYYLTDTHWRQETLTPVAKYISEAMGNTYTYTFTENSLDTDFSGVYYGQLALPVKKDTISYLTGSYIDGLSAKCYDTGKAEAIGVYCPDMLEGDDKYEFFLSGSKSLITIDNPAATTDKRLVIFRDSFSSSMAPLLAGSYARVTLVDIRYMSPAMVGRFVKFDNTDILFLYSTQLLNNSVGQFIN